MLLLLVPKDRDPDLGATLDPAAQRSDVRFDLGSLELVDERPAHALSDDRRGTKLVAGAIAGGAATLLLMVAMVRSGGSNDSDEQPPSPTMQTELARPSVQGEPVRDIDVPMALVPAPEMTPVAVVAAPPAEPTLQTSEVAPASSAEVDALARVSLSDATSSTQEVPVQMTEAAATDEAPSAEPAFAGLPSIADDDESEPGKKPIDAAEAGVDPEPPDEPRHEPTAEVPAEPSDDQGSEPQGVTAFAPDETPATADEPQV
jgi:hypothetical protein